MKMHILMDFLNKTGDAKEISFNELKITEENDDVFTLEIQGEEWLILNKQSAIERVEFIVKDSISYINSDFLGNVTDLPEKVFIALQEENEAVLTLIKNTCGISNFTNAVIDEYTLGHFLNTYDGGECELICDYVAYRQK